MSVSRDGGLWQVSLEITADGKRFEQCVAVPRVPGVHAACLVKAVHAMPP